MVLLSLTTTVSPYWIHGQIHLPSSHVGCCFFLAKTKKDGSLKKSIALFAIGMANLMLGSLSSRAAGYVKPGHWAVVLGGSEGIGEAGAAGTIFWGLNALGPRTWECHW